MRNREHLALAETPSGGLPSTEPPAYQAPAPALPSPDGAVLEWLDDLINDVTDAATRLEALARRLRET